METRFKKINPKDVFITSLSKEEQKYSVQTNSKGEIIRNRPSGNEVMDLLAELINRYGMRTTRFYEKQMGLAQRTLNGFVVSYSDMDLKTWKNKYIMLRAKELLLETRYSIDEVGKRLGFSGIKSFSAWFIRTEKEYPSYWRIIEKSRKQRKEAELFKEWRKNYCPTNTGSKHLD